MNSHANVSPVISTPSSVANVPAGDQQEDAGDGQQQQQQYQQERQPRPTIHLPANTTILRADVQPALQQQDLYSGMSQYPAAPAVYPGYANIQHQQNQYYGMQYSQPTNTYYQPVHAPYMNNAPQAMLVNQHQHAAYHHQQTMMGQSHQQAIPHQLIPTSVASQPHQPLAVSTGMGTHMQQANVVASSAGTGQQLGAQQMPKKKKLLTLIDPKTQEVLNLAGNVDEAKKEKAPELKQPEEEEQKTASIKLELLKKVTERVKDGETIVQSTPQQTANEQTIEQQTMPTHGLARNGSGADVPSLLEKFEKSAAAIPTPSAPALTPPSGEQQQQHQLPHPHQQSHCLQMSGMGRAPPPPTTSPQKIQSIFELNFDDKPPQHQEKIFSDQNQMHRMEMARSMDGLSLGATVGEGADVNGRKKSLTVEEADLDGSRGQSPADTPDGNGETPSEEQLNDLGQQLLYMEQPAESNNMGACVYNRKLLLFLRNLNKVIKAVPCPKTEEELENLGLSRRGMPPIQYAMGTSGGKKRFDGGGSNDQFKVSWQHSGTGSGVGMASGPQFSSGGGGGGRFGPTRPPYSGRNTTDNKMRPKKGISGRHSLERPPLKLAQVQNQESLPKKSATAWKSKREERFDMNAAPKDDDEAKYDKMRKDVRGLLNKITPSTYDELTNDFLQYKIHDDPKALVMIIDLIFDKAVEEPHFCPLYSDLCKKQVEEEHTSPNKKQEEKTFRNEIIQKCQKTFLASNQFDEKINELRNKISALEENDEKGRASVEEEIELRRSKEKRRLLGIIRFIAQLYRHQLLIDKIIYWCVIELVKRYDATKDEVYIEYAVELLETVGKVYEKRQQEQLRSATPKQQAQGRTAAQVASAEQKQDVSLDKVFDHLSKLKLNLSNRIKFAIMDLEDLRKNKWVPRGGEKGPKTIEEVREDVEKEKQENELERIEHEKQKEKLQPPRKSSNTRSYAGRSSADRRSIAASASNSLTSGSKTESRISGSSRLKDVDVLGFGTRKTWQPHQESSGSGAPSPGGDSKWRSNSRQRTDSPKEGSQAP